MSLVFTTAHRVDSVTLTAKQMETYGCKNSKVADQIGIERLPITFPTK